MKRMVKMLSRYLGVCCLLAGVALAWGQPVQARTGKVDLTEKVKQVPARAPLYDQEVKPLEMQQCAQCHLGVFKRLKAEGKKHQKECTFCHEIYHSYAPGKVEYKDAIPKCVTCHGSPHSTRDEVQNCSKCHSNAHSPVDLPSITAEMCVWCHTGPPQQVKEFPSKHTDLGCTECHTKHGFVPNCTDCHSDKGGVVFHVAGVQANSNCLTCHAGPHKPMVIKYAKETPKELCGTCHKNESHERVYKVLAKANSKHFSKVTCAGCHEEHGQIPQCAKCHDDKGHRASLKTEACLRCHTNPHDPMNIVFTPTEPKEICGGCHTKVLDTLVKSKTRHTNQTCAFCHPKHGELPTCQKCHGVPHGEAMLKQFQGKCGGCHGTAHEVSGKMKENKEGSLTPDGRKGVLTTVPKK